MFSVFFQSYRNFVSIGIHLNAINQINNNLLIFGSKKIDNFKFFSKLTIADKKLLKKTENLNESNSDEINLTHRFICDKIRLSINFFLIFLFNSLGGPITIHEYMQLCVSSAAGYYNKNV